MGSGTYPSDGGIGSGATGVSGGAARGWKASSRCGDRRYSDGFVGTCLSVSVGAAAGAVTGAAMAEGLRPCGMSIAGAGRAGPEVTRGRSCIVGAPLGTGAGIMCADARVGAGVVALCLSSSIALASLKRRPYAIISISLSILMSSERSDAPFTSCSRSFSRTEASMSLLRAHSTTSSIDHWDASTTAGPVAAGCSVGADAGTAGAVGTVGTAGTVGKVSAGAGSGRVSRAAGHGWLVKASPGGIERSAVGTAGPARCGTWAASGGMVGGAVFSTGDVSSSSTSSSLSSLSSSMARGLTPPPVVASVFCLFEIVPGSPTPTGPCHAVSSCDCRLFCAFRASSARAAARAWNSRSTSSSRPRDMPCGGSAVCSSESAFSISFMVECITPRSCAPKAAVP